MSPRKRSGLRSAISTRRSRYAATTSSTNGSKSSRRGSAEIIIMVGDPGVGESFKLRGALQDPHAWICGPPAP